MALTTYEGPGSVYFGASLLAESSRVRARVSGNNRRVYTMRKGLGGRSRGPVESEITVDNAIPLGGLEHEYVELCINGADVRLVQDVAGKRYQYEGWIDDTEIEQSQDNAAGLTFTVIAGAPIIL